MKKNYLKFLYIFIFNFFFIKSIELILPIIPENKEMKNKIILNSFYKGNEYKSEINNSIGTQINISENKFNQKFYILISQDLKIIKSVANSAIIKGLKIKEKSNYHFYEVNMIIEEEGKKIAYIWDIKKIEIDNFCFPEETFIICAPPDSIRLETDSKNYFLNYKLEEKSAFPPLIFLPTIYLNIEKFLEKNFNEIDLIPEMRKFHTPPPLEAER